MRNLPRLTERLYSKPWLTTPTQFQALHTLLQSAVADNMPDMPDPEDDTEDCVSMVIDRGLAIIPIYGTIGSNLSMFEKTCFECTDVRDVKMWLDKAATDPSVESIMLDINSPGGEVTYVDELANHIKTIASKKEVIAYCNDIMCSAAYYLAAGCTSIVAHPASSAIGSIGVYSAYLDTSERYKQEGLAWELFSAGRYKTQGMDGTKLSDDFKRLMQQEVDNIYTKFTEFVKSNRANISDDTLQGLSYDAKTALELGLVDELIEDPMTLFTN